jgi:5-deoxy-glucuronate isomerase
MNPTRIIRRSGEGTIVTMRGPDRDMLQELSLVTLAAGESIESEEALERVFLLLQGTVRFVQGTTSAEAARVSQFDEAPWALQVASGARVTVTALQPAELALLSTANGVDFPSRIHSPQSCRSELRGVGAVGEAAARIVRTLFDTTDAPHSNLVVGEVVTQPGRWSSYPPHHHPQPEIYHYRFAPENGFGFAMVGDQAFTVHHGDTTLIREGQVHPQATAPGYAMWYLWSIRHLDGNRYTTPEFVQEHAWTARNAAPVWTPKSVVKGGSV